MPYCPKCGKEVKEDAVFCPNCGANIKIEQQVVYRRHRDEKNEKDEKGEKSEKSEKSEKNEGAGGMWGAVMGGLIVLWLGVTFLLHQYEYFSANQWWSIFLIGLGIIIILRGLIMYGQIKNWRASSGLMIGGAVVALIGFSSYIGWAEWWPMIIILIGAWVILSAVMNRGSHPKP